MENKSSNLKLPLSQKFSTLKKGSEFAQIKKRSLVYSTSTMKVCYNKSLGEVYFLKCGFIITRKCGNSVKRNRLKRIIKERLRLCISATDVCEQKINCVVIVKAYGPTSPKTDFKQFETKLMKDLYRVEERLKDVMANVKNFAY